MKKTLEIDVQGEGVVTAADITHDSDVEVLNPDLHIATLSKSGHFRVRLSAARGRGYRPADRNKREDLPIGVMQSILFTLQYLALTIRWRIRVSVK